MKYFKLLILSLGLAISSHSLFAESSFISGKHYDIVAPDSGGEPFLEEFFSYGCPACYNLEALIERIKTNHPNLKVKLTPVFFQPGWDTYAKAYLIAKKLNVLDKSHRKIFHQVHVEKKPIKTDKELKVFFLSIGVAEKNYDGIANSYWLNTQVRLSKQNAKKNKIPSAPSYLVNKRYLLDNKALASAENIEAAVVELSGLLKNNQSNKNN